MAFEDFEGTRTKGKPVDLYFFRYGIGDLDFYAHTDHHEDVTVTLPIYGSVTFTPLPIKREAIKSSGTLDKSAINVSTKRDADVAELFRVYPPTTPVSLIIRQGHIGDPDSEFLVIWAGRVLSCRYMHSEAEMTCEPIATAMRRTLLRRHYQYGCPHALYLGDSYGGCHADKEAATETVVVSAAANTLVTLPVGWNGSRDKLKFRNGLAEWTTASGSVESRTILTVDTTTNVLGLSGIVRDLAPGDEIRVVLGCDHLMDGDCKNLHDSVVDYGGNPWIPTKNPYGAYNNFY